MDTRKTLTRLSRVPLPRALAHADGEGRLSGGSCASTEGAHGQGHWNGGAAQRHLSTFTTAATTQPSSIAIRKLKSGCSSTSCERGSRLCDSIVRLQLDDSQHHAGCGSGCCQRRYGSSEITQASCHYSGGGGGCCSCASGNGGGREAADAPCLTPSPSNATVLSVAPRGAALVVVPTTSRERARWRVSWRRGACCWPRR